MKFSALVIASMAAFASIPASAQEQPTSASRQAIPDTVSPEAAAKMRAYFAAQAAGQAPGGSATAKADPRKARIELGVQVARSQRPEVDRLGVSIADDRLGGVGVVRIRPRGYRATGRVLLYVHGGGFTTFTAHTWLLVPAQLAAASGLEVISVDYTDAPDGNWRSILGQTLAVYKAVTTSGIKPRGIGVVGDSAGGSIAAGAVLRMRDEGLPLPGAVLLMSPWSDVTGRGDTYTTLAGADPILSVEALRPGAAAYAPAASQADPLVSPVYGDFSKEFPPTLIQGGTREIFLSNFVRQYQAIRAGGGEAVLDLYEGMPHVFQVVVAGAPEQITATRRAAQFFADHLFSGVGG